MNIVRRINTARLDHNRRGSVVAGCLIALGVVIVILIGVGIWVALSWKGWAANLTLKATEEIVNQSALPASEKPEMIAIVEGVTVRFKDGDITFKQFGEVFVDVMASEVLPIGAAYVADNGYVQPSGLTDEEKADGSVQLMRIAQGLHDGSIDRDAYVTAFQPMVDTSADATMKTPDAGEVKLIVFRDNAEVTDEQLKEVIENARTLADENGVTATPAMIDLSDALQAVVDGSLSENSAPDASDTPAGDEGAETEDDSSEDVTPNDVSNEG